MKKKLLIIATLIGSILVMTACGNKKEDVPSSAQEAVQEASVETEAAQEAVTETEAVQEVIEQTEAESVLEDFTGDMDLSGSWDDEISKRASMDITKNEDGSYTVHCIVFNGQVILFELKFVVPNVRKAESVAIKWQEAAPEVYKNYVDLLID